MANGKTQRLRFQGFSEIPGYGNFYSPNQLTLRFVDFAPEEQKIFESLRDGNIKLVSTPGLSMHPNFPSGKIDPAWISKPWIGKIRVWENKAGKKVEARLICLTDEDASLLKGDYVTRVALNDLSDADQLYIDEIKHGKARVYFQSEIIVDFGWDNMPGYTCSITGEQYEELALKGSSFEAALESSISHVTSKMNPDFWTLDSFLEEKVLPHKHLGDWQSPTAVLEASPYLYTAEFTLNEKGEKEARKIWGANVSPKSWKGSPTLQLHILANGEILEAKAK